MFEWSWGSCITCAALVHLLWLHTFLHWFFFQHPFWLSGLTYLVQIHCEFAVNHFCWLWHLALCDALILCIKSPLRFVIFFFLISKSIVLYMIVILVASQTQNLLTIIWYYALLCTALIILSTADNNMQGSKQCIAVARSPGNDDICLTHIVLELGQFTLISKELDV